MTYSREELQNLFKNPYRLDAWRDFLHRHLGVSELLARPQRVHISETECGIEGRLLGEISETEDHFRIGFFDVTVPGEQVKRRRVGLRNVIVPWLRRDYDVAVVAFHSSDPGVADWRVSFICDLKGEATAPKRFTYVFGGLGIPLRTPVSRFVALSENRKSGCPVSMEAMRKTFSVEALSDEFFSKYKVHYEKFVSYVTGKKYEKVGKKWKEKTVHAPHPTLHATFRHEDKLVRDYVKKLLGRLVFLHFLQKKGWLGARKDSWTGGDPVFLQNIFKYASEKQQGDFLETVLKNIFFNALNTDRSSLNNYFDTGVSKIGKCRIPYLNGGLFEKDDADKLNVYFPARYFLDLLDFFAEYNFTIDENDADEAEVGIDPEMLGRIFENLLEDNKDKGAYYTPKEIVRYMCRQTLFAYLSKGESQTDTKAIAAFLETRDRTSLPEDESLSFRLVNKLRDVKICDPAIGSGAFPMGLLRELHDLRFVLEPDTPDLKSQIIENNIYGVDIEKGAVDIARLRFWLALVVDAAEPTPLPNLDFKIMQGNSLVESWKGHDLSRLTDDTWTKRLPSHSLSGIPAPSMQLTFFDASTSAQRRKLRFLLHCWFTCSDHREREVLREKIRATVRDVFREQGSDVSLDQVDPAANSDFFLWHLWFAEVFDNGGFDIVIGNPPYVKVSQKDALSKYYKEHYGAGVCGRTNLYKIFVERGLALLRKGGAFSYIMPNSYIADTSIPLRDFLLKRQLIEIIEYTEKDKVFPNVEQAVTTIVVVNDPPPPDHICHIVTAKQGDVRLEQKLLYDNPSHRFLAFAAPVRRMRKQKHSLTEWFEIHQGEINLTAKKRYYGREKCVNSFPMWRGDHVGKYVSSSLPDEYCLQEATNQDHWQSPRLVMKQITNQQTAFRTAAFLSARNYLCGNSTNYLLPKRPDIDLSCFLGLLNSKAFNYLFTYFSYTNHITTSELSEILIPDYEQLKASSISEIVGRILALKSSNPLTDTATLEAEVDALVYELYGLTKEERAVVESSFATVIRKRKPRGHKPRE